MAALLLFLYTPLGGFLKLAPLAAGQFFAMFGLAAASVLWYEIVKLVKRKRQKNASAATSDLIDIVK
jgi:Ca2+-transporting ATPase